MFRVALTGGIASGKSTITKLFELLKVPVIDTDIISHQLMQKGEEGYHKTLVHFGESILNADKSIDRQKLRDIVFNQPNEKIWLEEMLHPLIRDRSMQCMTDYSDSEYVLFVVPLLFETNFHQMVDHVVAIDCPPEIQLQRLIDREKLQNHGHTQVDHKVLQNIINAQLTNAERLKRADSTLKNADNLDRSNEVENLHKYLLKLSLSKQN